MFEGLNELAFRISKIIGLKLFGLFTFDDPVLRTGWIVSKTR